MVRDFEKLANDSIEERDRIKFEKNSQPVNYAREAFDDLDDYFASQLYLMSIEAEDAQKDSQLEEESDYQRSFFTQLHFIRRYRERVHSEDIPIELYYFLEEVISELDPSDSFYVFSTGLRVKQERFDSLLHFTAQNLKRYEDREEYDDLKQNPIMIQLPRNELQNPFTYCLIPHEIFHNMSVTEQLVIEFDYIDTKISDSEKEELCVDALTLNYMGPSYALSLIELYDRIEEESISAYPPIETRRTYLLDHLKNLKSNIKNYSPYTDAVETAMSIIAEERGNKTSDYVISDFEDFDSQVVTKMKQNDIPTFLDRYNRLRDSLQIENIESGKLNRKLEPLLDTHNKTDEVQPVAIPVHPVLLFNLLVPLVDVQAQKDLQTGTLSSLRKWHARKYYEIN